MSLSTVGKQVKYGLMPKKSQAPPPQIKARLSMFDRDDSDDEEGPAVNNDVSRVNALLAKRNAQLEKTMAAAASEEPDIYDYDGAYDGFKAQETSKHQLSQATAASRDAPKARYVSNLLSTAKMREKEKERVFEKNLLKERKEEDKEFGDKDKFVTAAYKKKLLEDKKWEYEDRLADEVEQRTDVRKSGMEGFYANLLTKNVAMGGDVDAHAVSVYTAGSSRQSHVLGEPAAPEAKKSFKFNHAHAGTAASSSSSSAAAAVGGGEDEKNGYYSDAPDANAAETSRYVDTSKSKVSRPVVAGESEEQEPAPKAPRVEAQAVVSSSVEPHSVPAALAPVAPVAAPMAVPDKNAVIMSAKDRYLARKRALEG